MKNKVFYFTLLVTSLLIIQGCEKEKKNETVNYKDFISVDISSITNSDKDSIYIVEILNNSNESFEKYCSLIYSIYMRDSTTVVLQSTESIANKKDPSSKQLMGTFNLQQGGNYYHNLNLNDLNWINYDIQSLEKGKYELAVELFIEDPKSANNKVMSNKLNFAKE